MLTSAPFEYKKNKLYLLSSMIYINSIIIPKYYPIYPNLINYYLKINHKENIFSTNQNNLKMLVEQFR